MFTNQQYVCLWDRVNPNRENKQIKLSLSSLKENETSLSFAKLGTILHSAVSSGKMYSSLQTLQNPFSKIIETFRLYEDAYFYDRWISFCVTSPQSRYVRSLSPLPDLNTSSSPPILRNIYLIMRKGHHNLINSCETIVFFSIRGKIQL